MATVFKDIKDKMQRRSTYDCGGNDPAFRVRALGLKGTKITSTHREDSDDMAGELADMWTNKNPPTVWLTISASTGVRVTDTRHNNVLWYDMNEISHCNVHRDLDSLFVFVGQQGDDLRCHAFECSDATRSKAICMAMADAFQKFFQISQRREAVMRRSVLIETAGECSLITDDAKKTKHYLSDGNLNVISEKATDFKRPTMVERWQRFRFMKKPFQTKWAPIPTDDDGDIIF